MSKRQRQIALGAAVLLTLGLMNLPERTLAHLKWLLSGTFLPLFGLSTSAQNLGDRAIFMARPRSHLIEELTRLEAENTQLRLDRMQAEAIWQENQRLRGAVGWGESAPWDLRLAKVITREPANWWRSVRINKGSRDGVRINMAVLTADGLVGRVNEVALTSAQVVLVGDPHCEVSAMVDRTRDAGVIEQVATAALDGSVVELKYLPRQSLVQLGDTVVTSGLGGIFPEGIRIGEIVATNTVSYGLLTEAKVQLASDVNRLEEVWLVFP